MLRVGDTFGGYRLTGELGAGGMGVVFTARDLRLERAVALKVLPPELAEDPDYRRRFLRESTTLAQLDSPHVVHVYDHGEVDGRLYLVTQLVAGGDLAGHLREHGPLAPELAVELTAQVASALADAHAAGVLHRDVKPSNILLRRSEHDVFGYLCDFGIATRIDAGGGTATDTGADDEPLTQAGVVAGTWAYLAPERTADDAPASVESDVYSAGCVLWATLSGQAPYHGSSAVQVALHHVRTPVPQLAATHPWASRLNPVLARAMAKEPGTRYRSATELRAALLGVLQRPAPPAARPVAPPAPPPRLVVTPPGPRTALRSVDPAPAAPIPRPAAPPSPGRRRGVVVGAVLTALAVAAGITLGAVAMTRDDDPPATASTRGTAPATETPAPEPTPADPTTATRTITCWDGGTAASRGDCGRPSGAAGLEWVFPSFDAQSPDCADARAADPAIDRPQQWECELVVRGAEVLVRYSELSDTTTGRTYYDEQYAAGVRQTVQDAAGRPGRYVWRQRAPDDEGVYKLSSMYVDYPYSISIESSSLKARDDVLAAGLGFRDPRDIRGSG